MYQPRARLTVGDIHWTDQLPFQFNSEVVFVHDGDWDLKADSQLCPPPSSGPPRLLAVAIGRHGDVIADCHSDYTIQGDHVFVSVVGRHTAWDAFRAEIIA